MIWKWKAWNIVLTALGLVLIIFSLIWLLVIFPSMNKLPADHHEIINFDGTVNGLQVNITREQTAIRVEDNVLIMNQTITTTFAIPVIPQSVITEELGVDRSTREYVKGYGDMDRSGQFCFPEGVEKRTYDLWIMNAGRPLEARYLYEETFHGLRVFNFEVSEQDVNIGTQLLNIVVEMKVEPLSGTTVYSESNSIYKIPNQTVPVLVTSQKFTDDTINDLVNTASSARTMLLWAKVYGFWLGIGLGIVLTLVGTLGAIRTRPKEVA